MVLFISLEVSATKRRLAVAIIDDQGIVREIHADEHARVHGPSASRQIGTAATVRRRQSVHQVHQRTPDRSVTRQPGIWLTDPANEDDFVGNGSGSAGKIPRR